tara:strand:- start:5 stop:1198 length:1194 start_codon:yes stop_codon:yes gene_type:complete
MALKSSSPINLAALRQDYSMLPKIAAVKAQSSNQFLNAVSSGLEKRKERIEKKELNEAAKKMIEPLLAKPEFQARFGTNANVDEVLKLIGDPRKAVQLADDVIKSERELEDRQRRIARESQIFAQGVYDLQAAERLAKSNEAFSSAIFGLSQDKDYKLTSDQANLMSPDQLQKFVDIKAKQTPDQIGTIDLGNGAFAITSNGEYKGMFTVPKDPNNALTARLRDIEGLNGYFEEVKALFDNGKDGAAVRMLNALDVKIGGEMVDMDSVEDAKAIVGINLENLKTGAGEAGGETGEKPIQILQIDGKDVSSQEKPEPEPDPKPEPEPVVEQTSFTPAPKQREVSIDEQGSIYDESGKIRSPALRIIVENFFPKFANKPLTEEEQKELSKKVKGLIAMN